MNKLIQGASALALTVLVTAPVQAATPSQQATASAKIYRPLTISFVQNLDFGTIVLSGAGAWGPDSVSMDQNGAVTCGSTGNLTCSGLPTAAKYHLVGTNNAAVTISVPAFNLTSGASVLAFTPYMPTTSLNLGAAGSTTGLDFGVGGSLSLSSTTADGVYTGTFNVTANYQ